MGSASFPSLHLPTFFAKAHTQERLTRNRLVVRLYASVNFSVNESRDGSRRTASGLPTTRRAGRPLHTSAFYKGESQEKNFSADWKERRCSPGSPAHFVLRASGAFVCL